MNPKRIHCETFQGGSWSWLQMIRSLACPPWSLGMWCMRIEKAYWQELGTYVTNQRVESLKMSFRAQRKALTLTHNLWIQVISKAALQIRSVFFSTDHLYLKHFPTWHNYLGSLWNGWWGGWNVCEGVEGTEDRWKHSEPFLASVKVLLAFCHVYTKFHWALSGDHLSKVLKFLNTKSFV